MIPRYISQSHNAESRNLSFDPLYMTYNIYFPPLNRWEALFRNCHIFHEFEHFLIVIASAKSGKNQIQWFGLIESRIRHFITNIEKDMVSQFSIAP